MIERDLANIIEEDHSAVGDRQLALTPKRGPGRPPKQATSLADFLKDVGLHTHKRAYEEALQLMQEDPQGLWQTPPRCSTSQDNFIANCIAAGSAFQELFKKIEQIENLARRRAVKPDGAMQVIRELKMSSETLWCLFAESKQKTPDVRRLSLHFAKAEELVQSLVPPACGGTMLLCAPGAYSIMAGLRMLRV